MRVILNTLSKEGVQKIVAAINSNTNNTKATVRKLCENAYQVVIKSDC